MKEIIRITISLTMVCVAAAIILGAVYAKTDHMRKLNEEKHQQETIESLLGFGHGKQVPGDLRIFPVFRYVLTDPKGATMLGYLLPTKEKGYVLVEVELSGDPANVIPIEGDAAVLAERATRDAAVNKALPKGSKAVYAQTIFVANLGDKRLGYVIPGITQGFKTFIKLMVSLDPEFTITGIAITESEEDPGLGAEIEQLYFRNQFAGKSLDVLKNLKVVKEPLPEDYFAALEPTKAQKQGLTEEQQRSIRDKHVKDDIYALTGATISSKAVTEGVRDTVRKFVYRLDILSEVVKKDNLQVAF